jgi:asparagine synthase (glutamine-hydrolysing)
MKIARELLSHRGPDGDGVEIESTDQGVIALGHTRLAIIDLSSAASQPMSSPDGRFTITFNGEIYNFEQLRDELRSLGHRFESNSDTEVLLACWAQWEESCLRRLIGMFSFALFDRRQQRLFLVRDAFGIKPLYFHETRDGIIFASELSSLSECGGFASVINTQRAYEYLVAGTQDDGDLTFVAEVQRVRAAHLVRINTGEVPKGMSRLERVRWWSPSIRASCRWSERQAAAHLRDLFLESVRLHLRSDVPVCVALSGGLDSSAIACAARLIAPSTELHSFSFVASGETVSEEPWIDLVNDHIGAVPHKVRIASGDLDRDFEKFIACQGEPVGSPSVYAQWRVFQAVRGAGFKVALEGQGGDELLGGYFGYPGQYMRSLLERGDFRGLVRFASNYPTMNPGTRSSPWRALVGQLLPNVAHRIGCNLTGRSAAPEWIRGRGLRDRSLRFGLPRFATHWSNWGRRVSEVLRLSLGDYGLSHLLRYGDRNAMAWSVENRTPFLTIPLAEFMLSLPEQYLISSQGQTKSLFRIAMRGIVPDAVLDRRDKVGFEAPTRSWMRAPALREFAIEGGAPRAIDELIDFRAVSRIVQSQVNSSSETSWQTWRLLNLVSWARRLELPRSTSSVEARVC